MKRIMKHFNKIRTENNDLQRLQEFKQPFTKFVEQFVHANYEETHEDLCEFYLLQDSGEEFEKRDLDFEIEETAKKLARLLELKENDLKFAIRIMI